MAMRETERSLRWYFVLVGAIATLRALSALSHVHRLVRADVPTGWRLAIGVPVLFDLVLGPLFIFCGARLSTLLVAGGRFPKQVVIIAAVAMLVQGALLVPARADLGPDFQAAALTGEAITAAFGLLISIYLYRNVVRLVAEARDKAGIPPDPPAARVV